METIRPEKTNLTQMFVFAATFFSLFQFLMQYMPKKYDWFLNLSPKQKIGTAIRLLSSFHAALATFLSIFILCTDIGLNQNKLLYSSFGISFTLNISIGFLAYDCLIMFLYRDEFELGYGIHHCVSIIAFYACTTDGVFPYIALSRLISEASTVFINNRWLLLTLKKKDSKVYFWNGIITVIVFGMVRILTIIPNWMVFFSLIETPAWNSIIFRHKFICVCSSAPLDILNIYWFAKIIQISIKHSNKYRDVNRNKDDGAKQNSLDQHDSNYLILKNKLLNNEDLYEQKLVEKNE